MASNHFYPRRGLLDATRTSLAVDAGECVTGKAASAMKPGERKELKAGGYDFARLMRGGDVLAYAGKPVELGVGRSRTVADPLSGELLALPRGGRFHAYALERNAWRELPGRGVSFPKYDGHGVSAVPMCNAGVVPFFSSRPQGMKTVLYRHAKR